MTAVTGPLPCGPHCRREWNDGVGAVLDHHDLTAPERCAEHRNCYLHAGIHYHAPVPNGVIKDLKAP